MLFEYFCISFRVYRIHSSEDAIREEVGVEPPNGEPQKLYTPHWGTVFLTNHHLTFEK